MNRTILKNSLPVFGLVNAVVKWFKPHALINHKTSKSLLLFLCRNFKLILPTVVLSSFWIFDTNESEYGFYELTLSHRVQQLFGLLFGHQVIEFDNGFDNDYEEDYIYDVDNERFINYYGVNNNAIETGDDDDDNDYDDDDDDDDDDDYDDENKSTVSSCSYMEEFNPDIEVINYYVLSPEDYFGYYTEFNYY